VPGVFTNRATDPRLGTQHFTVPASQEQRACFHCTPCVPLSAPPPALAKPVASNATPRAAYRSYREHANATVTPADGAWTPRAHQRYAAIDVHLSTSSIRLRLVGRQIAPSDTWMVEPLALRQTAVTLGPMFCATSHLVTPPTSCTCREPDAWSVMARGLSPRNGVATKLPSGRFTRELHEMGYLQVGSAGTAAPRPHPGDSNLAFTCASTCFPIANACAQ
jgi:hypothetical protein